MAGHDTATLRDRRHRRRPDRPHARRAARAPGARRVGRRRSTTRTPTAARAVGRRARRAGGRSVDELLARPTSTRSRSARRTDTHADLIVAAARAGKAIFCEKPVSLDLAEVDRALAAVEEAGVPFQIGFNRRFDPAHAAVPRRGRRRRRSASRTSCASPAATPRRRRWSTCARSGGIFLDMTIHDFDMARFVTGSEVVEVLRARRGAGRPGVRARPATSTPRWSRSTHANGCLTTIDNSRQAVYGYDQRVEVFGSARDGGVREPARARRRRAHGATARAPRRCRTSSSSATCRATCASGRRSSRAVRDGDDAAGHAPPTRARRS